MAPNQPQPGKTDMSLTSKAKLYAQRIGIIQRCVPHAFSKHSKKWTIGQLKLERLRVKNERRAKHGLPPVTDYALI
jgi:hypothetical protein